MTKKKFILVGAIVTLAIVAAGAVGLALNAGKIAKTAIETFGPKILGVPVGVKTVVIFPRAGRGAILGLRIGNPPGYSDEPLIEVGRIALTVDVSSFFSSPVRIRKIEIDSPVIRWEGSFAASNLGTILAASQRYSLAPKSGANKAERQVTIDELVLTNGQLNAKFQAMPTPLQFPLPPVTMTDVGQSTGGATFSQVATQLIGKIAAATGEAMRAGRAAPTSHPIPPGAGSAFDGLRLILGK